MTDHLQPTVSNRGFRHMPVVGDEGELVAVYESSAASAPRVWLAVEDGPIRATVHLTAEQAWQIADQLRWLVANHYHGDSTPDWAT